jgi:hypothetical protein
MFRRIVFRVRSGPVISPVLLFLAAGLSVSSFASTLPFDPIPDPQTVAVFSTPTMVSFDPTTDIYTQLGTIQEVQFPGEVGSTTDPLVLDQATLLLTEVVPGGSGPPAGPSQIIQNLMETISVDGVPVFQDFVPQLSFSTTYTTPNFTYMDWQGPNTSVLLATNPIDSPFLATYSTYAEMDVKTVSVAVTKDGRTFEVPDSKVMPEPSSLYSVGGALVYLVIYLAILHRSRRQTRLSTNQPG